MRETERRKTGISPDAANQVEGGCVVPEAIGRIFT